MSVTEKPSGKLKVCPLPTDIVEPPLSYEVRLMASAQSSWESVATELDADTPDGCEDKEGGCCHVHLADGDPMVSQKTIAICLHKRFCTRIQLGISG